MLARLAQLVGLGGSAAVPAGGVVRDTDWVRLATGGHTEAQVRRGLAKLVSEVEPDSDYEDRGVRPALERCLAADSPRVPPPFLAVGGRRAGQFALLSVGRLLQERERGVGGAGAEADSGSAGAGAAAAAAAAAAAGVPADADSGAASGPAADASVPLPLDLIVRRHAADVAGVDVAHLQSLPRFRGATFMVASNFNAVEAVGEESYPDAAHFLTNMAHDHTQGPAASISAGAAAVARVCCPFYDGVADHAAEWSQTATRQVELLADVADYIRVRNGYADLTETSPLPSDDASAEAALRRVHVAYHRDVAVTSGRWDQSAGTIAVTSTTTSDDQRVDQVFAAAVNTAQGLTGRMNGRAPGAAAKVKLALDAAFTGAYLAAQLHQREELVLTLIGAGVFGNSVESVMEAVARAHTRCCGKGGAPSSLQRVSLVLYSDAHRRDADALVEFFAARDITARVAPIEDDAEEEKVM